jgi:large subunit ribosomal protein L31e
MTEKNIEREYIIPLRKEWLKASSFKRAKKAVRAVREFLAKHMKSDFENVKVGRFLNEKLWERGIKNPPHKVKVKASKDGDIIRAELAELTESQKKILEDDKKAGEQLKKEKEEKFKKAKAEEEKAKKEAEKVAKETEDKIKKEYEKKEGQDLVTKEAKIEDLKIEKALPKEMPQHQGQHVMRRSHSEAGN